MEKPTRVLTSLRDVATLSFDSCEALVIRAHIAQPDGNDD
jgi:hypothetical protein